MPFADASDQSATMPEVDLRWTAALMCALTAAGGAIAGLLLAWVWLWPSHVELYVLPQLGVPKMIASLDGWTRLSGFLASMLPVSVLLFALYQAFELFYGYRLGRIFTFQAPTRLRRIGFCMVALGLLRPLTHTALALILTANAPPGQRMLSIALSLDDYMIAFFGGLVLAISHVMVAATKLAEDHSKII